MIFQFKLETAQAAHRDRVARIGYRYQPGELVVVEGEKNLLNE